MRSSRSTLQASTATSSQHKGGDTKVVAKSFRAEACHLSIRTSPVAVDATCCMLFCASNCCSSLPWNSHITQCH
eukprot:5423395-Amphidinium_carterae.1